jgi:diguanylate cyclase (GGDEF)-like protein
MVFNFLVSQSKHFLQKTPLPLFLIIPFVLQMLVALGLTGWLSWQYGQKAMSEMADQLQEEQTAQILERLTTYVDVPQHLINHLALTTQLGILNWQDLSEVERFIWLELREQNHESLFIASLGLENGAVAAVGKVEGKLAIRTAAPGTNRLFTYEVTGQGNRGQQIMVYDFDVKQRPWYTTAIAAGKPTWTSIYPSYDVPVLQMSAVRPVVDDKGEVLGVANAALSLAQMSQFLQNLETSQVGTTFIIERSGFLVASSVPEPLYQTRYEGTQEIRERLLANQSRDSLVRETTQALSQKLGDLNNIRQSQEFEFQQDGQPQFVQVTPFTDGLGIDWLVVGVIPKSEFMGEMWLKRRITLSFFMIALVLSLYVGIITVRLVSRPLQQLNEAAKNVAQGDFDQRVNADYVAEVQELGQSFNQMTTHLQDSFSQLQRLNQALAQKESRLNQFLEALPVGVSVHDLTGKLFYINKVGLNLLHIDAPLDAATDELATAYQIYYPQTQQLYKSEDLPVVRALAGETVHTDNIEFRRGEEGIVLEVHTTPIYNEQGEVEGAIAVFQDVRDRKRIEEQLLYQSLHDSLTSLPNRTYLMQRLRCALERVQQHPERYFALLFLDLDRFKVINDSLGHLVGDQLLITVAQKLQTVIRSQDVAARFGGDEFVILLEPIRGTQDSVEVARRIFAELQCPLLLEGREVFISTSIGIVFGTHQYTEAADLLRDADIALYRAKAKGRNCYEIFGTKMYQQVLERLHLEQDLRQAIDNQKLSVYYQPIVALETTKIIGFEALARWFEPVRGFIPPNEFIQIAEETGMIVSLDRWMMQQACQQLVQWQQQFEGLDDLKMSVNLAVQDLQDSHLLDSIFQTLQQTGLAEQCLSLEITESNLIPNISLTNDLLSQLRNQGIHISIDDFGTGYSSLNYLQHLAADTLKIDGSFIRQMYQSDKTLNLVKMIITLSHQLGLDIIAEGIETQQQVVDLRQLGCQLGQGYYFSKPLTAEAVTALLSNQDRSRDSEHDNI